MKVYEKIRAGIWVYNGVFRLVDAHQSQENRRLVWRFRLELVEEAIDSALLIPPHFKAEVWRRDGGVMAAFARGAGAGAGAARRCVLKPRRQNWKANR